MVSGIISWVVLYALYIVLFAPFVTIQNTILGMYGVKYPMLNTVAANLTSTANAAFVIIAVGIFFFMLIAPFIFEPTSVGGDF